MPYVAGESLRGRLVREPQLPVEEALIIAREVADALEYAHQHGVVHRDIKPENILLSAGHAVVADFGIARAIQAAGAQTVTQTGILLGTPAYMSPEQAAGESELDGRSDIYSLGCVLYEMWAGAPPFTASTAQAVIAMRFTHRPPEVSSVRDGVPLWGSRAVARALARDPAERYATAAQLAAALIAPEPGSPVQREAPTDKSIAVLPFTNMSSDPEIARTIADRLQVSLTGSAERTLLRPHTENLEAYHLYLKGRGFLYKRGVAIWHALEAFRAALELDPEYALASAGLADAYTLLGMYGVLRPPDALPQARAAARRSVELGPELAEAHNAVAGVRGGGWDWPGAARGVRRALEVNPSHVPARGWHGGVNLPLVHGPEG